MSSDDNFQVGGSKRLIALIHIVHVFSHFRRKWKKSLTEVVFDITGHMFDLGTFST